MLRTQFHVERPWGQCQCESGSSSFQPGEGPSRGLLRDCTTSPMDRFAALIQGDPAERHLGSGLRFLRGRGRGGPGGSLHLTS